MISFWNRLLLGKEQKFSRQIYNYMFNLPDNNYKWLNKIKEILSSVGRYDLWQNQEEIRQRNIHKQIKEALINKFKQSWQDDLMTSNKGQIYYSFKENIELEPYLKLLTKQEYTNLFKFRTANHHLPVETGRYDGTPYNERKCTLCRSDQIGSEQHYLLQCNYFRNERIQYLNNAEIFPQELSFKSILSSTSIPYLKKVSKLVSIIMEKFKR